jgi:hypothetical protein
MALVEKIKALKELVSKYETSEFLTFLAGILLQIPQRHTNPFLKNLMSPMRQLFFLGLLNLNRDSTEEKRGFSKKDWEEMSSLLHEIEMEYFFLLGFPKSGKETLEDIEKISVTMPTFMNYFFNGPLAYQEQEIERIEKVFKDYEPRIVQLLGISFNDFIVFYDLLSETANNNLSVATRFLNENVWQDFTKDCIERGIVDPKDWVAEAPEEINAYARFRSNPGSFLVLDLDRIRYSKLSSEKFEKIIKLFTCVPRPTSEISYYTDENELLSKPFVQISDKKYLAFYPKQYLNACYKFISEQCILLDKKKALKKRDIYLEKKTEQIFKRFFKKEGYFYSNYSIDNGNSEQDILILYKNNAIIIEAKASSYRAPMRDANKAFDKLKSDFEKSIQYGYEQTSRVVNAFAENDNISILNQRKELIYDVITKRYKTYSIIVTWEKFGHIQTNLKDMLEIGEKEDYPWCVNIDDLEAFLLVLARKSDRMQRFITFLKYRQEYHGHLICSDELELCGSFLMDEMKFKNSSLQDETIVTGLGWTKPIEKAYMEGMGFDNERHWKEKKDKNTGFLYHD